MLSSLSSDSGQRTFDYLTVSAGGYWHIEAPASSAMNAISAFSGSPLAVLNNANAGRL
ncbi:hypothetical protein WN982_21775 [Paraburkholderia sp. IMGN_8]|uniref:hypothetical protein n=1 Tax=Paraburkholderia sp. IMGN_8 TaxID=3136564 RepID=UPI00310156E2